MQTQYVRDTLRVLAERAGWEKRIHPHGLRHTYAVALTRAGFSPEFIRRQLGHSHITTTSIYLSSISSEDIAQAMESVDFRR
jgi:site-specific recombinase XerD